MYYIDRHSVLVYCVAIFEFVSEQELFSLKTCELTMCSQAVSLFPVFILSLLFLHALARMQRMQPWRCGAVS